MRGPNRFDLCSDKVLHDTRKHIKLHLASSTIEIGYSERTLVSCRVRRCIENRSGKL